MTPTLLHLSESALRLTHPQTVHTNRDTGLIRLIAFLTMLFDHFGKMFFPHAVWMRMIGRLSFPLFAYCIAIGAVYTSDGLRYLSRIVGLMLISQPLYAMGLAHEVPQMFSVPFLPNPLASAWNFYISSWAKPNILLTLSLGLAILLCLRNRRWVLALGLYVLCKHLNGMIDYGVNGIRLMLIFYCLLEHPLAMGIASLSFFIWWSSQGTGFPFFGMDFSIRIYALPSLVFVALPMERRIRLPRWIVYGFYPAHLAILAILCRL